jgi:hypothetical protein
MQKVKLELKLVATSPLNVLTKHVQFYPKNVKQLNKKHSKELKNVLGRNTKEENKNNVVHTLSNASRICSSDSTNVLNSTNHANGLEVFCQTKLFTDANGNQLEIMEKENNVVKRHLLAPTETVNIRKQFAHGKDQFTQDHTLRNANGFTTSKDVELEQKDSNVALSSNIALDQNVTLQKENVLGNQRNSFQNQRNYQSNKLF